MQAGQFDTPVTFQSKSKASDGGGGFDVVWPELGAAGNGQRWAAFWQVRQGREDESQTESHQAHTPQFRLIVRTDEITKQIKAVDRVEIDGIYFNIKSVGRPDRRRGTITFIVQEGQAT